MPIVTPQELAESELYSEIVSKITRNTESVATMALVEAESMAKTYLSKYDLTAIFGEGETLPTFTGGDVPALKKVIKIIAANFLIRKSSPNIQVELFRADFEYAIKFLEGIQAGQSNPNLPYKPDNPDTDADESIGQVFWASNTKRTNAL